MGVDLKRTLTDIEGRDWGQPDLHSQLVVTCHHLRHKPLEAFTVEDFRVLVGQNISLDVLLPLAIAELERAPLAAGDLYPGDLLMAALTVEPAYLEAHGSLHERLREVYRRAREMLVQAGDPTDDLDAAARRF